MCKNEWLHANFWALKNLRITINSSIFSIWASFISLWSKWLMVTSAVVVVWNCWWGRGAAHVFIYHSKASMIHLTVRMHQKEISCLKRKGTEQEKTSNEYWAPLCPQGGNQNQHKPKVPHGSFKSLDSTVIVWHEHCWFQNQPVRNNQKPNKNRLSITTLSSKSLTWWMSLSLEALSVMLSAFLEQSEPVSSTNQHY